MSDIPYDVTEKNFCQLNDAHIKIWIRANLTGKHPWRVAYRVILIRYPMPVLSSQYASHIQTASAPWLIYDPRLSQLRHGLVIYPGRLLSGSRTLGMFTVPQHHISVCDKRVFSKLSVVVHGYHESYWDLTVEWFDSSGCNKPRPFLLDCR